MSDTSSASSSGKSPEKIATCIRKVANFSAVKPLHIIEKKVFNPELLKLSIPIASPKLTALFQKIKSLDAKDMRKEGRTFKHMIFTDIDASTYGIKIIASAFVANGFTMAFEPSGSGLVLKPEEELRVTKGTNFGVLCSKKFMDRTMSTRFKKLQLDMFNSRPENVHGDMIRFIILDQGFKEGIDLFDVKYVHLFEPLLVKADEKQAIGRGTRFCGQKGLEFHPRFGWPLYVFRYDVKIPHDIYTPPNDARTMSELFLRYSNIDMRKVIFAAELEKASQGAAVDHPLTVAIHQFQIETPPPALDGEEHHVITGGATTPTPPNRIMNFGSMSAYIRSRFMDFKYPDVILQNKCIGGYAGGAPNIVSFTPTQDFIRYYFQPSSAYKGMLLYHSVGTGKTCTAIATASTSFEKEGYNIMWVTRHTLKSDIWKNMFDQVCSLVVKEELQKKRLKLPEKMANPRKYASDRWMEPMSYKQFSNMLLQKNKFYEEIVKRNGQKDPLKKTLIIIDEAHKLYSEGVAKSEKPDTEILEKMIQHSYATSGDDSCRVLLMTATPFTEDGMEMIKLLNLLRPKRSQLPSEFNDFAKKYLDDNGFFTKTGLAKYRNDISGYISYLNRSQDARNFAHPVLENVLVDMTVTMVKEKQKPLAKELKRMQQEIKEYQAEVKAFEQQVKAHGRGNQAERKKKKKECTDEVKAETKRKTADVKQSYKKAKDDCKQLPKDDRKKCTDDATYMYENAQKDIERANTEGMKKCDEDHQEDADVVRMKQELLEKKQKLEDMKDVKREKQADGKRGAQKERSLMARAKQMKDDIREAKEARDVLAKETSEKRKEVRAIEDKEERKKANKALREGIVARFKEADAEYKELRALMNQLLNERKLVKITKGRDVIGDLSQQTALAKRCGIKNNDEDDDMSDM